MLTVLCLPVKLHSCQWLHANTALVSIMLAVITRRLGGALPSDLYMISSWARPPQSSFCFTKYRHQRFSQSERAPWLYIKTDNQWESCLALHQQIRPIVQLFRLSRPSSDGLQCCVILPYMVGPEGHEVWPQGQTGGRWVQRVWVYKVSLFPVVRLCVGNSGGLRIRPTMHHSAGQCLSPLTHTGFVCISPK